MSVKIALAGVGNCASALVQGVEYYGEVGSVVEVPGVMHVDFGGYKIKDIEFVAAFDVNAQKIGRDLAEAIHVDPNSCIKFAEVPETGVKVLPSPIMDGVAPHMEDSLHMYEEIEAADVAEVLMNTDADMLLNYLPVGSGKATRYYAEACIGAGCAFVNCIPEYVASDPEWAKRFSDAGQIVAGDDIKSQIGATIVHRSLIDLIVKRGARVDQTYQLNVGGNTDFENMLLEDRLETKKDSKTSALTSLMPYDVEAWAGPNGYIGFLGDNKICHLRIEGRKFGDTPFTMDVRLSVQDSPNSAGVVIDVVRAVKLAQDRGVDGPLTSISSYAFKHPPIQVQDNIARKHVEEFIEGKRER
jgi:myo-inositol-1-phosphate synthase